ncbi:DedA family protein [Advenella sp. RU8]|uniref:DedA family protein n=1 Tax=Advenella sp. RU8 TaxID=3399575 RepID=UPI003AAAF3CD
MDQLLNQIITFIQDNQVWAGPIIALLAFGESMLIIGLAIPATAILLAAGTLIGSGVLSPWPIILWGIIGAILGDALSYWIGRWFGMDITRKWPLNQHRKMIARTRLFFYKYGVLSVFLGRFMGPIRSTIPAVAGIMNMSHIRFQIANVTSAIIWMPIMLMPGYLGAKGAGAISDSHGAAGGSTLLIGTILSVVAGVWLVYSLMKKPPENKKEKQKKE